MGFSRRLISGLGRYARGPAIAAAVLAMPFDSAHAGFFDFLFNPPPPVQSQPPGYYSGRMAPRWHPHAYFHERRPRAMALHHHPGSVEKTRHAKLSHGDRSHVAVAHAAPGLMDDDSLQDGDAVMTDRGVRIFTGDSGDHHKPEDFAKLSETKGLSSRARTALVAIDANRSDGRGSNLHDTNVMTGRSAADSGVSTGKLIMDPRGRMIRYVGP